MDMIAGKIERRQIKKEMKLALKKVQLQVDVLKDQNNLLAQELQLNL